MNDHYIMPWYENTERINNNVSDFLYYLIHPGEALGLVWSGIMPYIYWIAVIGSVIFIIYYAATKSKKCLRIAGIIIITYIIIKGIDAVI